MKKNEIINGNKLIAKFMGHEVMCDGISQYICYKTPKFENGRLSGLHNKESVTDIHNLYNTSWDWLMPVVEKIESLGYKWNISSSTEYPYHICNIQNMKTIEGISAIDATYGACIEFIKWYSLQKKL